MSGLLEDIQDVWRMKFLSYSKMKGWTIRVDALPRKDAPKDLISWCMHERGDFLRKRYTYTIDGYSADAILEIILRINEEIEVYWDWKKREYIVKCSCENLKLGPMRKFCKIVTLEEDFYIVGHTEEAGYISIARIEEIT